MEEFIFDYIALHIECRLKKRTPPELLFSGFAGWNKQLRISQYY